MTFPQFIEGSDFLLGEGSLYERLRRSPAVELDPQVAHAGLVYDDAAREVLAGVHREYLDIGQRHGLPIIASSPTWRANSERIARSEFAGRSTATASNSWPPCARATGPGPRPS